MRARRPPLPHPGGAADARAGTGRCSSTSPTGTARARTCCATTTSRRTSSPTSPGTSWPAGELARRQPAAASATSPSQRRAVLRRVDRQRLRSLSGRPPAAERARLRLPRHAGAADGGVRRRRRDARGRSSPRCSRRSRASRSARSKICGRCCSTRRARCSRARTATAAQAALERLAGHRFAPLLHHYQLSNWILYARAYADRSLGRDAVVRGLDGRCGKRRSRSTGSDKTVV